MLNQSEFDRLIESVENRNSHLRAGQALMNECHNLRPEIYNMLVEECDCFYLDSRFERAKELLRSKIFLDFP